MGLDNFDYKKSLGQNFLIDDNIKKKIISSVNITDNSLILEVGPGSGAITKYLVNLGVPVIAFEIDKRLKNELDKIDASNLEVIYEDFLSIKLVDILSSYHDKDIHLVANLPYYITTPIINKMIEEVMPLEMVVMVQKEVGERFKASPNSKEYNSLSVFLQYYYDISKVTLVSKNCFVPKPKIDSVVIKFRRKDNILFVKNKELFFKLVKDSFRFKRKNLRNNLNNYDLGKINEVLKELNMDLTYRAEQLSVEDFVKIANYIS